MLTALFATWFAVAVAELVGDKTLYTLCALSSRYRFGALLTGASIACMGKMTAAVLLGDLISKLPGWVVAVTSAGTFLAMAVALWRRKSDPAVAETAPQSASWWRGAAGGFASMFFSEWGDAGQITAALLVARFDQPFVVWAGATLAVITKTSLALLLGSGLRRHVPQQTLRYVSVSTCATMGLLALLRID